ncbi:hypothetical protein XH83_19535 [Bradyrhizobium sp. CCBAU 53351]|uniref:glycoside hydrolase domain-containing protein n=1 Tax=Bradyrhizobium sp. CCBAU 53351 TaxID=1325114 RepID=UPI001887AC4A|nr:glycoside hydrolase domain-containing protein [Bradyrhizobium sp. CCBAU 53351]QOZ77449.1 hypothetical protein XH83_19535 [Bradyrhizobium sp. CCBAU 53351]
MASTPLEIIQDLEESLRQAYKKATTDEDRQKIVEKLQALSDLDLRITLEEFETEIAKLQAITDTLKAIITELQGHIDNLFMDQLAQVGKENGLLPQSKPTGGPPDNLGASTAGAGSAGPAGSGSTVGGIDCALDCQDKAVKIKKAGFTFVCRYYRNASSHYPPLSAQEVATLSAAGLSVVAVWESASDKIGHFSFTSGVNEATSAYHQALLAGQPKDTPIYFAVDADFNATEIAGPVRDYFRGIASGFDAISHHAPIYQIGVYGSGLTCGTLTNQGLAKYAWLAMSTGWRGSKTFKGWNIKQSGETVNMGFDYDSDVAKPGFGGFQSVLANAIA